MSDHYPECPESPEIGDYCDCADRRLAAVTAERDRYRAALLEVECSYFDENDGAQCINVHPAPVEMCRRCAALTELEDQ
jgi:hypothetical protein